MSDTSTLSSLYDGQAVSEPRNEAPHQSTKTFLDPRLTAHGLPRAAVELQQLKTLWFNTGTLCNITCQNCYIESSPKNDRLVYLTKSEVSTYLDEIRRDGWQTQEIGFTGGEPFMNPDFLTILKDTLLRGFNVTVLTNAMRPMQRHKAKLLPLAQQFRSSLLLRVSLDHYTSARHDEERGPDAFRSTLDGMAWLFASGVKTTVAGRTLWGESLESARLGYGRLFAEHNFPIAADDPAQLVLFPEMREATHTPEISTQCWTILSKSPSDIMCSNSRMVIRRKDSHRTAVVSCTLLPYDRQFELGHTLKDAFRIVSLNHRYCAQFCVLGGGSCSAS